MNEDISFYISKAMRFCSTKEVCISDITKKLLAWNIDESNIDEIINELINENFIDEKRYASAFVTDKFRFNNWGKQKIKFELFRKKIPEQYIYSALNEIDKKEYYQKAQKLFLNKLKTISEDNKLKSKQKVFSFMKNKGFEMEIIYDIADRIL